MIHMACDSISKVSKYNFTVHMPHSNVVTD